MSKVKTLLLATASSVVIAGGAMAADLPLKAPPPYVAPFSWTGCYVGAHWGWGWAKKTGDGTFTDTDNTPPTEAISLGTFNNDKMTGGIFGGQLGCNYQWPGSQWVVGIQGDIAGANISGTNGTAFGTGFADPEELPFFIGQVDSQIQSIASVTGRIGWAGFGFGGNRSLWYIKGGWAWMRERDHLRNNFAGFSADNYQTATHSGWTVGGGVEWALAFWQGASVFVEYNHYDFSHKNWTYFTFESGTDFLSTNIKTKVDTVKVGLNLKVF
jgi:outer membrane immunogenic protein